ncbi:hypothetical protein LY90DRAFT_671194, partial [Neocallimastix californiae]
MNHSRKIMIGLNSYNSKKNEIEEEHYDKDGYVKTNSDINIEKTENITEYTEDGYDDDFEEIDAEEMNKLVQAMNEENEKLFYEKEEEDEEEDEEEKETYSVRMSLPFKEKDSTQDEEKLPDQIVLDFNTSRRKYLQNEKMQKLLKRQKDLSNFIDFDIVDYVIFDHPPMSEYELYIRNYGNSNTVQVAIQSNEELISTEQQTDDWNVQDKYVQATSQYLNDCGSGEPNLPWLKKDVDYFSTKNSQTDQLKSVNMKTLKSFLKRTSNLMEKILESDAQSYIENKENFVSLDSYWFTEGYIALQRLEIMKGRKPISIDFSPNSSKIILIHWSCVQEDEEKMTKKKEASHSKPSKFEKFKTNDIITLFNYNNDSLPIRVLLCDSELTCCKYCGPTEQYIVGGSINGSLCLWDLESYDENFNVKEGSHLYNYYLHYPCYCTVGSFNEKINHEHPIQNILLLSETDSDEEDNITEKANNNYGSREEINEMTGIADSNQQQSFQFMSIDQSGLAKIWTAIKISEDSSLNLFEYDYGLNYNSKVRLISGNYIKIGKKQCGSDSLSVNNSCLLSNGRIIVCTNFGEIYQESRFGEACYPKQYSINESFTYQLDLDQTIILDDTDSHQNTEKSNNNNNNNSKNNNNNNNNNNQLIEEAKKSLSNFHKLSNRQDHSYLLKITAFCSSPFNPDLFLVGYDNSIVALYSSLYSNSLYEWKVATSTSSSSSSSSSSSNKKKGIHQISWSKDRPFVFYVLCSFNILHIFDLLESEIDPLYSCILNCEDQPSQPNSNSELMVTSFAITKSESKEYSSSILSVGWSNGHVFLYKLREDLSEMVIDEKEKFN